MAHICQQRGHFGLMKSQDLPESRRLLLSACMWQATVTECAGQAILVQMVQSEPHVVTARSCLSFKWTQTLLGWPCLYHEDPTMCCCSG